MKNLGIAMKEGWLVMLLLGVSLLLVSQPVQANPESVNVAIIGSPGIINGGTLPTSGADLAGISFTNLLPGSVNAGNLAPFDTVVLNVASTQMGCKVNTLTSAAKADLAAFVGAGNKMIIFDSECAAQDYSWLPFPFTTNNPGAKGSPGTLTIVEENTLSSNNAMSQFYIDALNLGKFEEVGDMNVMTTLDPKWCVDMSGTNYNKVTGPVHTYAKTGVDVGLYIYNGLDQDKISSELTPPAPDGLRKIWVQELRQPFNPSNLPCGLTVVGITLAPATATNFIGQTHTVTATLKDLLGNPQVNIQVTFSVISGPNSGATGTGTTDSSGQATFTYTGTGTGAGTDEIQASFTNKDGKLITSQTVTKEWINNPPVADPGGPYTGNEGSAINIDGSASSDPDPGDSIASYQWVFGDGNTGSGATVTHTYEDNGVYTVSLTVTDTHGATNTSKTTATVYNVDPLVYAGPDTTINEGDTFSSSGSFIDPGSDSWTATVDYGDSTGVQPLTLTGKTFALYHTYADNCVCIVTVNVSDDDGGAGNDTAIITVNNVNPTVGPIASPLDPEPVNAPIDVSSPFTDPGKLDTHSATWDWDDGTTSAGTVDETIPSGTGTAKGNHAYTTPGIYTLKETVTDKDNGKGTAESPFVVVYDPNDGFVTGGGWIDSPKGAYIADPTLTGQASFGFVSKYQKGANVPKGQTEFQFHAGDLNFHSETYQWLVVAGARAQFKGTGTINGEGNYGFLLTAIDGAINGGGDVDKFRIKIVDKTAGTVVYDNVPGASEDINLANPQDISGGSIVIHKI